MNDNQIDQRELLIQRGEAATHLLSDQVFQAVISELAASAINSVFSSEPEHHKQRESGYHSHRGVVGIVDTLKHWKLLGEQAAIEIEDED